MQNKAKKKLLFFHHHGLIGGAGLSGAQVLLSIPQDKYDVTVCCSTDGGMQMYDYYRELGFSVIAGGPTPRSYTHYSGAETLLVSRRAVKMLLPVLRDRARVRELLLRERPDLVVVNSMTLFWIGPIATALGMHTVCFFRETYAKEWLGVRNAVIRRTLSEHFDAIAFISENDLSANKNVRAEKVVICDAVDLDRYAAIDRAQARRQLGLDEDRKYLLYVGGFSRLKGAHVVLETMLRLKDEDASLLFVGAEPLMGGYAAPAGLMGRLRHWFSAPYRIRAKRMAETLRARGQLVLLPLQKDIAPFYIASDALIAPSTKPHQLRPIYEAGAAKIPVITTRFAEIAEFADDARAYLAKNGDAASFAAAARAALFAPDAEKLAANYDSITKKNAQSVVQAETCALFDRLYDTLFMKEGAEA